MFFSLHFPISDLRKFISHTGLLEVPGWPLPTADSEFVRYFGNTRTRMQGGLGGWIGENVVCEASRALKFNSRLIFDNTVRFKSYKFFYFDGLSTGRFDIGISSLWPYALQISGAETHKLLIQLISEEVFIRNEKGENISSKLIHSGKHLARLYQRASTCTSFQETIQPWWVQSGSPIIILEYRQLRGLSIKIPDSYHKHTIKLSSKFGFDVTGSFVPFEGGKIKLWVIKHNNDKSSRRKAHELRIYLSRLHAEHEGLRLALRAIMNGKIKVLSGTTEAENLQFFLNRTTKLINQQETQLKEHDVEIAKIARESIDHLSPGEYDTLINSLDMLKMRGNIFKKIVSYSDDWQSEAKVVDTKASSVNILFVSADPTDAARLRIGEEIREIQEKLQLARLREKFNLQQKFSVRIADITQAMLDAEPTIVHFSGHGTSSGELCFENNVGKIHPVETDALSALFEQFSKQVDCVILNACYSEIQAKAISKHINYVIGMSNAIPDSTAIAFSVGFYQSLGAGRSIVESYNLGCVQVKMNNLPDGIIPVLMTR
jgi:hypothetical protein